MKMESHGSKNDLPLMANSNEIQVIHFIQDIKCDLHRKIFHGDIYLILQDPSKSGFSRRFNIHERHDVCTEDKSNEHSEAIPCCKSKDSSAGSVQLKPDPVCAENATFDPFLVKLDSHDIVYHNVEEVIMDADLHNKMLSIAKDSTLCSKTSAYVLDELRAQSGNSIHFCADTWCLRIWKPGVSCSTDFPTLLRIRYETIPNGASLRWAKDQDGNACVYTSAMWVNNRTFLPCQEYGSFCTWQASITVDEDYVVLMSGESEPTIQRRLNGQSTYTYYSSMPLPSFTLAIAIGKWSCVVSDIPPQEIKREPACAHNPACRIPFSTRRSLPWRIFAPKSLLQKARVEFADYLNKSTAVVQDLFGASPFPRVDLLVYPDCSQDMALSNPSLIFVSQSMLAGDGSLCIKLGHELSHFWFGLLLGAKDWTEEWLSEGFATFVEDIIHARVQGWDTARQEEFSELRSVLRLRNLEAELRNTKEELQKLRPNEGNDTVTDDETLKFVKDGMNPNKQFTQLHYLKGYFLLRHLSSAAGVEEFAKVLKEYIVKYHGCMVLSQEFVSFVFEKLPQLRDCDLQEDEVYREWLDTPGLPKVLNHYESRMNNVLYKNTLKEANTWNRLDKLRRKRQTGKVRKCEENFEPLEIEQQVLLLEELLKEDRLTSGTLSALKEAYHICLEGNPDVGHRWCELVVKHKCAKYYTDVKHFLIHHQAMGVYLYGELMISRCSAQKAVAEQCYRLTSEQMETGTRNAVHMMLYGEPFVKTT